MELLMRVTNYIMTGLLQTTPVYISLEQFLLVHFTILAILVTLISITSALTNEVRQDLIDKYYYKHWITRFYVIVIVLSFCEGSYLYYTKDLNTGIITGWIFFLLFLFTVSFIIWYMRSLTRRWLYNEIYKKFEAEFSKIASVKQQSDTVHGKTYFESMDDLIKNISHIEKANPDFIEEASVIKKIVRIMVRSRDYQMITNFFTNDLTRISNKRFISQMIAVVYDLKFEFYEDLGLARLLQDELHILLSEHFSKIKEFDAELNTTGLYLSEFLDIRYLKIFEKTTDLQWLQDYTNLISNTINSQYRICKLILLLDLSPEIKKRYLIEQLASLNKTLEHFSHYDLSDFYDECVSPSDNSELAKQKILAVQKKSIIEKQREELLNKKADLFYQLMFFIDKGELPGSFFEIALKIFNPERNPGRYYKYEEDVELNLIGYDPFEGGVQSLPKFRFNKYRLIVSFYYYLNKSVLDIDKFAKENFVQGLTDFERELDTLTDKLTGKYFSSKSSQLEDFLVRTKKALKQRIKAINDQRLKFRRKSRLNQKDIDKFKADIKDHYTKMLSELAKFMIIENSKGGQEKRDFFGLYKLYSVEEFIDEFYENVYYDKDLGNHIGRDLSISKLKGILDLIDGKFKRGQDKEIVVKDIYSLLTKEIESNKEYFLFYNTSLEIYKIPNIKWVNEGIETARLLVNNSTIHFCNVNTQTCLLFEKGIFRLKQYQQGYKDHNEYVFMNIERLEDEEENKKLMQTMKIQSSEELGDFVKVRIAEKFEVERVDSNKSLIRLII